MRATKEYRLSFTEEAKKIVEGLTLEQKVDLMSANFYADKLQELLDSLSSDDSHYNMTPYPAGGIEGVIPPWSSATAQEVWCAERARLPVFQCHARGAL